MLKGKEEIAIIGTIIAIAATIIGFGVWCGRQSQAIEDLNKRIETLNPEKIQQTVTREIRANVASRFGELILTTGDEQMAGEDGLITAWVSIPHEKDTGALRGYVTNARSKSQVAVDQGKNPCISFSVKRGEKWQVTSEFGQPVVYWRALISEDHTSRN